MTFSLRCPTPLFRVVTTNPWEFQGFAALRGKDLTTEALRRLELLGVRCDHP